MTGTAVVAMYVPLIVPGHRPIVYLLQQTDSRGVDGQLVENERTAEVVFQIPEGEKERR